MVHFHIHTNGEDSEDVEGKRKIIPHWVIRSVWIGLSVFLWTAAIFIAVEAIYRIAHF
jgi:hypothetical protein